MQIVCIFTMTTPYIRNDIQASIKETTVIKTSGGGERETIVTIKKAQSDTSTCEK